MPTIKKPIYLISVVFFLSGCSALIFETIWFRTASIVLGSSIWSAAAVLMAFMGGLGLGNALMALRGDRVTHPLRTYIAIELVIGISGVCAIYFLPTISPLVAEWLVPFTDHGSLLNFFRFCTAFVALLLPSIAMGMTIPLLQKFLYKYDHSFSKSLGILYGFNTLGAVLGTLIAEYILIDSFGIHGSGLFACAINLLLVFILLRAFSDVTEAYPIASKSENISSLFTLRSRLLPPFLAGFILLALEVIWFRYMLLVHSGTSEVFALMLAIVLAGIGFGGLIASRISMTEARLQFLTRYLPLLGAITLTISFYSFDKIFTHYFVDLSSNFLVFTLAAVVLMLPSCIVSGVLFPVFGEYLFQRLEHTTQATGVLTFTNTMGAAMGSGVATFILLPKLGIEISIFVLGVGYIFVSLFIYQNQKIKNGMLKPYIPILSTAMILLLCFPYGALEESYRTFSKFRLPKEKLIEVREGMNETLQYYKTERFGEPLNFRLVTNSISMSGNNFISKRYMKLYVYFPYIFNREIKDVLQISYGVGSTAEAVTSLNSVERFDVVDISKDVLDMSTIIHSVTGSFPLKDKRTRVYLEDGRFFLQTTNKKYDLITGEPPPPKNAGIVNLYTQEYFELIHKRLKSKGMVTYWLPVHDLNPSDSLAIIKAFCLVFKDCSLWNGGGLEFMLVGVKDGIDPITEDKFKSAWDTEIGPELKKIGFESPALLGATFMADSEGLRKITEHIAPVTDNFPHRISPSLKGVNFYFYLYAELLDIERRKKAYANSQYVNNIFPEKVIEETLSNFKYENLLTGIFIPAYKDEASYFWEDLTSALLKTELKALPLLLLNSSPREDFLVSQMEHSKGDDVTGTQAYQLSYIKSLLVRREYKQAASQFEKYFGNYQIEQDKAVFLVQLYMVTKALAGDFTAKDLQPESPTSKIPLEKEYVEWFKQRF